MKFSIIIPVYKAEKHIRQCIDSILGQEFEDWEIILVDDGSPDNCPQICDNYAHKYSKIKVIHQKNSGVSIARNNGLKKALGEYIMFLDSDDTLIKDSLMLLDKVIKNNIYDIIFCNFFVNKNGTRTKLEAELRNKQYDKGQEVIEDMIMTGLLSPCWNKVYKRKFIIDNAIMFDSNFIYAEDLNWILEMLLEDPICLYSDIFLVEHYVRPGSVTTTKNIKKDINRIDFCDKWAQKLEITTSIKAELSRIYMSILDDYYKYDRKERVLIRNKFSINHLVLKNNNSRKIKYLTLSIRMFGLYFTSIMKKIRIIVKGAFEK